MVSGGAVPDLRYASTSTHEMFEDIVRGGARAPLGMPSFKQDLSSAQVRLIHAYILNRARESAKYRCSGKVGHFVAFRETGGVGSHVSPGCRMKVCSSEYHLPFTSGAGAGSFFVDNIVFNKSAGHAELRIGFEQRIVRRINLRRDCLEAGHVNQEVQMRGAIRMTLLCIQQCANWPVHWYRIPPSALMLRKLNCPFAPVRKLSSQDSSPPARGLDFRRGRLARRAKHRPRLLQPVCPPDRAPNL